MLWFILGLIVGFIIGFILFAYGQRSLEKSYVRNGIAKLDGKYYAIRSYDRNDSTQV